VIADQLDALNAEVSRLTERRRRIWRRRRDSGTTRKVLAEASRCVPMNVTHGLEVAERRASKR
jgi:hypothetical protein